MLASILLLREMCNLTSGSHWMIEHPHWPCFPSNPTETNRKVFTCQNLLFQRLSLSYDGEGQDICLSSGCKVSITAERSCSQQTPMSTVESLTREWKRIGPSPTEDKRQMLVGYLSSVKRFITEGFLPCPWVGYGRCSVIEQQCTLCSDSSSWTSLSWAYADLKDLTLTGCFKCLKPAFFVLANGATSLVSKRSPILCWGKGQLLTWFF